MIRGDVLLRARGLTKHFHTSKRLFTRAAETVRAVENVSIDIRPGRTLAVVGESGSGKSTTGRLILRLIEPTAGELIFDGRNLLALDPRDRRLRRDLQVIFQDPRSSLNPRRTIYQTLRDPLLLHGLTTRATARSDVSALIERVGLTPAHRYLDRHPAQFSGGQLQRIAIARAISLRPKLIVADEPVSALDASIRAQILQLMKTLQEDEGISFFFITHDLAVVRSIAHDVVVMYLGHVVEYGPVDQIFSAPRHPYTQALLSATPIPNPRKARRRDRIVLTGEIPSAAHPPSGCKFHTRCPHVMPVCCVSEPTHTTLSNEHAAACHLLILEI